MKVQPYVSSEDGRLFDVSINANEISFSTIELTEEEVSELVKDILEQMELLRETYQEVSGGSAIVGSQKEEAHRSSLLNGGLATAS
jgi:hypothetical protein